MTDFFTVVEQICTHDFRRLIERLFNRIVDADLISALGGVALRLFLADAPIVDD